MELIDQLNLWISPVINVVTPYLKQGWNLLNDYTYIRAGILIFISYLIARLFSQHIPKLLLKLTRHFNLGLGDELVKLTPSIIFQIIFFSGLGIISTLSELSDTEHFIALSSIKSLIIIAILIFVYRVLKSILEHLCKNQTDDNGFKLIQSATLPLFENLILLLLTLGGIHQVFGVWNVDMTALLASAGIAGLAIGMASKDTLSDVIAGILILTDAPYRVGDIIQIGASVGMISSIGIRSTRIVTKDNVGIIIPNGKMGASTVVNESSAADTSLRIKLPVQVAYGVKPDTIRTIMTNAAKETANVIANKKIKVVLSDFQQYQITFTLLCWIPEPNLKSATLSAIREKIYLQFLEKNIPIALAEKSEVAITEQADMTQQVSITSIPPLEQSIAVDSIPEMKQSISITDIPELLQSVSIKDIPNLKQSVEITKMPDRNGSLSIKEIPDLFGSGSAKKISKLKQESTLPPHTTNSTQENKI